MNSEDLFVSGRFTLHSGGLSDFKIDCDFLSDGSIEAVAVRIALKLRFGYVIGVPRGGVRLARALMNHVSKHEKTLLIVDDVLTTGASMEELRSQFRRDDVKGVVLFARGSCPGWIMPVFTMHDIFR